MLHQLLQGSWQRNKVVDFANDLFFGSRLVVDGNNYCGSSGPAGVEAGGGFSWSSGGSSQVKDWSIRAGVLPTPAPAPSPTSHILVFEGLYLGFRVVGTLPVGVLATGNAYDLRGVRW